MRPLLATCLTLALISSAAPRTVAADKPNVLFIAVDDLNDWISCLGGHPQCRTPNIDRIAARGTLFTNAYCAAPACNPSRAALMTGRLPSTSGVYLNSQPWRPVMRDVVTLPQHFTANGYWVGGSGKMYHGRYADPASWQVYFPSLKKQHPGTPLPENRPLNGIPNTAHFDWGPIRLTDNEMGDTKVADWVIKQLGRDFDKPFFLACGIYRPHLPWFVPQEYFDQFPLEDVRLPHTKDGDLDDVPAAGVRMAKPNGDHRKVTQHRQWKPAVRGYLASVAYTDRQIGRVLDALDASPHKDNTIVVFWTDHGWHLGEKEHWRKFSLWEESARTPLMFVVPEKVSRLTGGTKAGTRCGTPVGLIDIYPTLIDLCGLTPRDGLDGHSLMPQLENPRTPRDRPALTTHGRNNHTLRTARFRYIRYANGDEELYDHASDPFEHTNIAGKPEFAAVKGEIAKWLPRENAPSALTEEERKAARQKKKGRKDKR